MNQLSQVNTISKNLGFLLLENGIKFVQQAYKNLQPTIFSYGKIREVMDSYGFKGTLDVIYDTSYAFLPIEMIEPLVWDTIILVSKFKYKSEFVDCDNFAHLTTALMSFFYGINTCGSCLGTIYNSHTGAKIAGHYFNILITYSGNPFNKYEMWLADSLNPVEVFKIEKGSPIIMGDWLYRDFQNIKFF